MRSPSLDIVPLGGLGEFGMNLTVYRSGHDALIVDAGLMFASEDDLGIDRIVPDLTFLDDCTALHGVIVTHAHEDHLGALPHLLRRRDVPVWAPPHARAMIRDRLAEDGGFEAARLETLPEDEQGLRLGPFRVTTLPATHSIPQSRMIVLHTPAGVVVHTADFKLDGSGSGEPATDLEALRRLGDRGVVALCCDSTNADRPGATPGEGTVAAALGELLDAAAGRVFVTTFASNVRRVEALARLAAARGRRVALVGSALTAHVELAERLGLARFAPGVRVSAERAMELPAAQVLVVATGSQAEPGSALARIAIGRHPEVGLAPGDRVVHSARIIPGNERRIGRMFDALLEQDAEVVTSADAPVHVSGHAARDDLSRVLAAVRPRYLIPIHGEYRQLWALRRLAVDDGFDPGRVLLARSGDRIAVGPDAIAIADRVPVGRVYLDERAVRLEPGLLLERRRAARAGLLVAVLAVDPAAGKLAGEPEIAVRGIPMGDEDAFDGILGAVRRQVARSVRAAGAAERGDPDLLGARIESDLDRLLKRRLGRQPLIVPVILDPRRS